MIATWPLTFRIVATNSWRCAIWRMTSRETSSMPLVSSSSGVSDLSGPGRLGLVCDAAVDILIGRHVVDTHVERDANGPAPAQRGAGDGALHHGVGPEDLRSAPGPAWRSYWAGRASWPSGCLRVCASFLDFAGLEDVVASRAGVDQLVVNGRRRLYAHVRACACRARRRCRPQRHAAAAAPVPSLAARHPEPVPARSTMPRRARLDRVPPGCDWVSLCLSLPKCSRAGFPESLRGGSQVETQVSSVLQGRSPHRAGDLLRERRRCHTVLWRFHPQPAVRRAAA